MREVQDIIKNLKSNRFSAITVEDGAFKPFVNYTQGQILANFGSIDNFFDHIEKKYPQATIIERRQNGTVGSKINYRTIQKVELKKPTPEYVIPQTPSLGSPNPSYGLGMPELIQLNVDRNDKNRLEIENEYLKKENERLKKVEDEYKEYKLSSEYSKDKSQQNNDLIASLLGSPVVQNLAEKLLAPKATIGLAQPQEPQDEFIRQYLALDENSKNLFRNTMYFSNTDQEFANAFIALIENKLNNETQQHNGTEN